MWYNLTAPGSFSDEKYDVEEKEHLLWKIANIVHFLSEGLTQQNIIVPLKTYIVHKLFKFLS